MTWVDLKRLEYLIERRILNTLQVAGESGVELWLLKRSFNLEYPMCDLFADRIGPKNDLVGWDQLSETKRRNRLNKVLERLLREHRVQVERRNFTTYLVGVCILDSIVSALEVDESEPDQVD